MKIAVLANLVKEISPATQGGSEMFVYLLVNELAKRDTITSVDLFAIGENHFDSKKVSFHSLLDIPLYAFIERNTILKEENQKRSDFTNQIQLNLGARLFKDVLKGNYDIIHNNATSSIFNSLSDIIPAPIVSTLHTNFDSPSILIPYSLGLFQKEKLNHVFVTLSTYQMNYFNSHDLNLNIIQHIYNGIDTSSYQVTIETDQNAPGIWIGNISQKHNKGLKEAIISTKQMNKKLKVIRFVDEKKFYEETIEPLLNKNIEIISQPANAIEKKEFYQTAKYLLYPIMWEEPFGLVFLESMTAGTPVIAFARGAVPEIIKDGETGFIVNSSDNDIRGDWIVKKTGIEGLCEAVEKMYAMSDEDYKKMRRNCREHVEKHFTIERMVDEYEKVYEKILSEKK